MESLRYLRIPQLIQHPPPTQPEPEDPSQAGYELHHVSRGAG